LVYDLLDDFLTSKYAIIAATAELAALGYLPHGDKRDGHLPQCNIYVIHIFQFFLQSLKLEFKLCALCCQWSFWWPLLPR
jgi:hypothetical protein